MPTPTPLTICHVLVWLLATGVALSLYGCDGSSREYAERYKIEEASASIVLPPGFSIESVYASESGRSTYCLHDSDFQVTGLRACDSEGMTSFVLTVLPADSDLLPDDPISTRNLDDALRQIQMDRAYSDETFDVIQAETDGARWLTFEGVLLDVRLDQIAVIKGDSGDMLLLDGRNEVESDKHDLRGIFAAMIESVVFE